MTWMREADGEATWREQEGRERYVKREERKGKRKEAAREDKEEVGGGRGIGDGRSVANENRE